jgi:hypothetical protein
MRGNAEYAKAEQLFEQHNRSKGAMMPGGFGFLSKKQQQPWIDAARKILSETM